MQGKVSPRSQLENSGFSHRFHTSRIRPLYTSYGPTTNYNSSWVRTRNMPHLCASRGFWLPPLPEDGADVDAEDDDITINHWTIGVPECGSCGYSSSYKFNEVRERITPLDPCAQLDASCGSWAMFLRHASCCGAACIVWGNGIPFQLIAAGAAKDHLANRMMPPVSSFYWGLVTAETFST